MNAMAALDGRLVVRPGRPMPHNLHSTRRDWASTLVHGHKAAEAPATLANLYSLCGQAHRLCAQAAIDAASGRCGACTAPVPRRLCIETMREHVRRLCLDWSSQFGRDQNIAPAGIEAADRALAGCPLFALETTDGLAEWIGSRLLGLPANLWLAGWRRSPAQWLAGWCAERSTALAVLLDEVRCRAAQAAVGHGQFKGAAPLRVHADERSLRRLATQLHETPAFALAPFWDGRCAETGPWTRLAGPIDMAGLDAGDALWLRLGSRLAELVALSIDADADTAPTLRIGALPIAPDEGLAWVEMARGLLVHAVRLDGRGDAARIEALRVLAPTEWNFHPSGAVACALEDLPLRIAADDRFGLVALMAAYDPCVPFEIESPNGAPMETNDA